jgi:hypothetical protein
MPRILTAKLSVIGLLVATLSLVIIFKVGRVQGQSPPCTSDWVTRLQHGIGSEAPCPNLANIPAGVSNLSFFIQYRSGFALSSTVQQRLAQLEQEAAPGNCNTQCQLTRQDINNILYAEFQSLTSTLTDAQINTMSQTFHVVPAWVQPNGSSVLALDSSGPQVSQTDFTYGLQQLRSGNSSALAAAAARTSSQVNAICNVLAYALPADWNVTTYSPYRVFVIAYYLASGDKLTDSYTECHTHMLGIQNWLSSQGVNAPCNGSVLWGDAGYVYTRPTSILFSDALQSDLLNRYAAVHGLQ